MTIIDDKKQTDSASPFEDSYNENRTSRPPAPPSYYSAREVSPPSNDRNASTTVHRSTSSRETGRSGGSSSTSRFGSLVTGSGWGIPGSSQAPPSSNPSLRPSSTPPQQSREVATSQRDSHPPSSNTYSNDLPPPSRQQLQQWQELDYEQREYLQYQQQQQLLQQQQPRSVGSNVGTALQDHFAGGRIGGLMGMQPSYGPGPSQRGGGGLLGLGLLGGGRHERGYYSDGGGGGRGGLLGLGLVGGRRERRRARRNGWD